MTTINNNKKLYLSTGGSRKATLWPAAEMMWSEFIDKVKTPVKSTETIEEYLRLPKSAQDDLKDVGGFVGGTFSNNHRKANNVIGRDLVTLDLDNIQTGRTEDILKRVGGLGCAAVVYSTRKHTDFAPRLRIVIPTDRTVTPDEYEPIARKIGQLLGIEMCDPTTFEASRLMYWPSCSSNSNYVCEVFDNGFCNADGILNTYDDWKDITKWPQVPGSDAITRRKVAKQENPLEKKGIIGAFCRTYTIPEAMDKFIKGMYEETDASDRFTFTGGSTVGGAVLYENGLFLYSHHATDPCSGRLVNAFDLIRLHMYGDLDIDSNAGTPVSKLPSFSAMNKLALADDKVSTLMAQERLEKTKDVFSDSAMFGDDGINAEGIDEENVEWVKGLKLNSNGEIDKTINNVVMILENDPLLKKKIVTDEFAGCGLAMGALPWNKDEAKRRWEDVDNASLYNYLELIYGLTGRERIDNALLIVSNKHKINDVKAYLTSLKWDGVRRIETLLVDYLGAEDNEYTRAVMKKSLTAAVTRAINGSTKFDSMPIIIGPQGTGKSTFLATLGKEWFSDSLTTFEGKEAAELIQGTWINEIGELTAMSKLESNTVKQFLSKTDDIYRAAYGRNTKKYPRRCVFFGTSNDMDILKDITGNRRFWPVDTAVVKPIKNIWVDLPKEVDQIWAEAYMYYQLGEPLYLSKELEKMAEEIQEQHRETSGREGMIIDYLETQVPANWYHMSRQQRMMFLSGSFQDAEIPLVPRDKICAAEIWVECLGGKITYMKKSDTSEINAILNSIPGWKRNKNPLHFGVFGRQRGFVKE